VELKWLGLARGLYEQRRVRHTKLSRSTYGAKRNMPAPASASVGCEMHSWGSPPTPHLANNYEIVMGS